MNLDELREFLVKERDWEAVAYPVRTRQFDAAIALVDKLREQVPVTWRWRPSSSSEWIYDPELAWLSEQLSIEKGPVYALPVLPKDEA